ncbi:MAG: hypothetical protein H6Q65_2775 [Firmicutes bacterium]|nr:hypothetical protein [Bacillota bacterium]
MIKLVDSLFPMCFFYSCITLYDMTKEIASFYRSVYNVGMVKGRADWMDNFYSCLGSFGKLMQTNRDKILTEEEIQNAEIAYAEFENTLTDDDVLRSRYIVVTSFNLIIIEFGNDAITVTRIKRDSNFFIIDKEYRYQQTVALFPLGYTVEAMTISLANGEAIKFYRPEDTLPEHQKSFEKFVNLIQQQR